ncbi:MAG: 2-amino-4-hydroxy-6-hydroxymethyldihydropteridine diphosphokinase [Puniceicoccales bacterium]|jgi:2-amino-4-hydroxy-6-hydroxymethyldihydropteridine diphosphokinase|nr:2-amino-4-hydroxy-6-hydroxymethyldihydropteridine diphosphokinase [Puniceicoccales bacterium]
MTRVYLSLGNNLGDRKENLREAITHLQKDFELFAISSLWETEPWGNVRQASFLNLVLGLNVYGSIGEFFARCQAIEQALGKKKQAFWGPRTIDIDLIFWGHEIYRSSHLMVPHPYWYQREFVLRPLLEIAPLMNPGGKSLLFWIRHCRTLFSIGIGCIGKLEGIEVSPIPSLTCEELKGQGLVLKGIVAVDSRDGIACGGKIPWDIPEDRSFFREKTRGGILCMGRKTVERLPHSFDPEERELWILSRTLSFFEQYPRALIFRRPEEIRDVQTDKIIWICGGGEVYESFLSLCSELYITRLLKDYHCDLFLNASWKQWFSCGQVVKHREHYTIECYRRTPDCDFVEI